MMPGPPGIAPAMASTLSIFRALLKLPGTGCAV